MDLGSAAGYIVALNWAKEYLQRRKKTTKRR
jgi:hypothetical protein